MKSVFPFIIIVSLILCSCSNSSEVNIELKYDENISLEYHEVIDAYQQLASAYPEARLLEMGPTDIGKPLHLFMISGDKDFDPASIRKKGKCIILVNNGIHPGEPEGIDASIKFAWDLLENKDGRKSFLDNTVIAIIPLYNIGGSLDRSMYYRTNQNGPIIKARRRNAKNMDLNRDFSKQETKNAQTFAKLFTFLNPDVFLDTHTTNGSDHQYTITLIATLHSKLDPAMGSFFKEKMLPGLYSRMEENSEYGMIPYVMTRSRGDIRKGIMAYNDHPYYSTGYAALFNCYSFMTENLVYKYFPDRVRSVIDFLNQLMEFTSDNADEIRSLKDKADEDVKKQQDFNLAWRPDMSYSEDILFKGYEYIRTQQPGETRMRGTYDHNQTWEEIIPFYTKYDPIISVAKPYAYIIPQAWEEIANKLKNNGATVYKLNEDVILDVESYYIENIDHSGRATQGHYINTGIEVKTENHEMPYYAGDFVVMVNQHANKYIVEMLEPLAPNSYLVWNFFDSILESHDFYSIWGFESHLMELLDEDENLKKMFEERKTSDVEFANDPVAQLQFLYQNAPMYEIERYNRLYPVARLLKETELSLIE